LCVFEGGEEGRREKRGDLRSKLSKIDPRDHTRVLQTPHIMQMMWKNFQTHYCSSSFPTFFSVVLLLKVLERGGLYKCLVSISVTKL